MTSSSLGGWRVWIDVHTRHLFKHGSGNGSTSRVPFPSIALPFSATPEATGCCVTIGMAGHRRKTGTLTTLVPKECEAWVEAILGQRWMPHVYRVEPHRKGMYYRVFLDGTHSPVHRPAQVPSGTVELLHSR